MFYCSPNKRDGIRGRQEEGGRKAGGRGRLAHLNVTDHTSCIPVGHHLPQLHAATRTPSVVAAGRLPPGCRPSDENDGSWQRAYARVANVLGNRLPLPVQGRHLAGVPRL